MSWRSDATDGGREGGARPARAHAKPEGDPALQMLKLEMPKDASWFGDTCLKIHHLPCHKQKLRDIGDVPSYFLLQLGLQS